MIDFWFAKGVGSLSLLDCLIDLVLKKIFKAVFVTFPDLTFFHVCTLLDEIVQLLVD